MEHIIYLHLRLSSCTLHVVARWITQVGWKLVHVLFPISGDVYFELQRCYYCFSHALEWRWFFPVASPLATICSLQPPLEARLAGFRRGGQVERRLMAFFLPHGGVSRISSSPRSCYRDGSDFGQGDVILVPYFDGQRGGPKW